MSLTFPVTNWMEIIFLLAILVLSIVIHEVTHGYVAQMLGDPTARLAGRLTLNPLSHIDLLGSIILPGLLLLSGSPFLFGWAKPVPYNPYNLKNHRWGEAIVAGSGPLINIILAFIFGIVIRFQDALGLSETFIAFAVVIVIVNTVLAIVNMIPIPPIDGSKVFRSVLPYRYSHIYASLEQMTYRLGPIGLILVLLLIIFVFGSAIGNAIFFVASAFTGLTHAEINVLLSQIL